MFQRSCCKALQRARASPAFAKPKRVKRRHPEQTIPVAERGHCSVHVRPTNPAGHVPARINAVSGQRRRSAEWVPSLSSVISRQESLVWFEPSHEADRARMSATLGNPSNRSRIETNSPPT